MVTDGTGAMVQGLAYVATRQTTVVTQRVDCGLMFRALNAPRQCNIDSAILSVTCHTAWGGVSAIHWYGHLQPRPDALTTGASDISRRIPTIANVAWAPGATAANAVLDIDVTTIVQELVNQDAWEAGNDLLLMGRGDPMWPP